MLFRPLLVGDVAADPEQIPDGTVGSRHRDEAHLKPDISTGPVYQGLLGEDLPGRRDCNRDRRAPPFPETGQKQFLDVLSPQSLRVGADQTAAGTVHVEDVPPGIDEEDDVRRQFRKRPVTLPAFTERLSHAHLLADIDRGDHDADRIFGIVLEEHHGNMGDEFRPVGLSTDKFPGVLPALR